MASAKDQADAILKKLRTERESLEKNLKRLVAVYGVLSVVLLFGTHEMYKQIYEIVGPKGVETFGTSVVTTIAGAPDKLVYLYQENKDLFADQVIDHTLKAMPELEAFLKNRMSQYGDQVGVAMRKQLLPQFATYIKENSGQLKARYNEAKATRKDLTFGMFLTDVFVDILDKELAKALNEDKVIKEAEDLQKALYSLQKSDGPITKRQEAERKVLVNFVIMAQMRADGDESPILEGLNKFLQKRFPHERGGVSKEEVLPDIDTDETHDTLD